MKTLRDLWEFIRNLEGLINWGGYPVLIAIVFAETGLLVGFFLPGDSLLVTAGVLVNRGLINPLGLANFQNLLLLNVTLIVTAILGDAVGYSIGYKAGPKIFNREQSLLFRKDHLLATQKFYEKHGGKTIIIARFMPLVRTFAPVVAGVGRMPYRRFAMFNVVGGIGWVTSMTFLGYFVSDVLNPKEIERLVYLIIVLSIMPLVVQVAIQKLAKRREAKEAAAAASERPSS